MFNYQAGGMILWETLFLDQLHYFLFWLNDNFIYIKISLLAILSFDNVFWNMFW